jgi:hypothetical protein
VLSQYWPAPCCCCSCWLYTSTLQPCQLLPRLHEILMTDYTRAWQVRTSCAGCRSQTGCDSAHLTYCCCPHCWRVLSPRPGCLVRLSSRRALCRDRGRLHTAYVQNTTWQDTTAAAAAAAAQVAGSSQAPAILAMEQQTEQQATRYQQPRFRHWYSRTACGAPAAWAVGQLH